MPDWIVDWRWNRQLPHFDFPFRLVQIETWLKKSQSHSTREHSEKHFTCGASPGVSDLVHFEGGTSELGVSLQERGGYS